MKIKIISALWATAHLISSASGCAIEEAKLHYEKAFSFEMESKYPEAEIEYLEYVRLIESRLQQIHPKIWFQLGRSQFHQGKNTLATESFSKAAAAEPNDFHAGWVVLASLYEARCGVKLGNKEHASERLSFAKKLIEQKKISTGKHTYIRMILERANNEVLEQK